MESDLTQLPIHDRLLAWFETHKKEALWGVAIVAWRDSEQDISSGTRVTGKCGPTGPCRNS